MMREPSLPGAALCALIANAMRFLTILTGRLSRRQAECVECNRLGNYPLNVARATLALVLVTKLNLMFSGLEPRPKL
jgi:hypothetical protein